MDILKSILNPVMRQFYEDGLKYIKTVKATDEVDPCHEVLPGSEEWSAWETYLLRRIGDYPWAMKEVIAGRLTSFTAPARWPWWFDGMAQQSKPAVGRPSHLALVGDDL